MESKQIWELNINTVGDPSKHMLTLNGELIEAVEACVVMSGDKSAYLDIKIPIYNNNLIIKTDATRPIDREIIVATTNKD